MADITPFGGLNRFDPTSQFGISDFFRGLFGDPLAGTFRVDVRDEGDRYEIEADLPGLHREMIDVNAKNGYLTISANMDSEKEDKGEGYVVHERRQGTVSRSFAIGNVDEDAITAVYRDGVLKVVLPKGADPNNGPRKISVD